MPDTYFQATVNFPQTSANRTRRQAKEELCEFGGAQSKPETLVRAGRSWDAAVREFNVVGWIFNRTSTDITLVAGTKTYSLPGDFRSSVRAQLLDVNGNEVWPPLNWIPYQRWAEIFSDQSTGSSCPDSYTALNVHGVGEVRYDPYPIGNLSYTAVRHTYLTRIALATGEDDQLNVPVEVDEAIFQLSLGYFLAKMRGFGEAEQIFTLAKILRNDCEREHRHWQEETGYGANG